MRCWIGPDDTRRIWHSRGVLLVQGDVARWEVKPTNSPFNHVRSNYGCSEVMAPAAVSGEDLLLGDEPSADAMRVDAAAIDDEELVEVLVTSQVGDRIQHGEGFGFAAPVSVLRFR